MKIYHYNINEYSNEQLNKYRSCCEKSDSKIIPQSIIAHYFTKTLLARYYNTDLHDINFKYNQYGKPFFRDDLKFSITHTANHVFIALSDTEIGIDAEAVRNNINKNLLSRTMTEAESEKLLKSDNFSIDFLKIWTVKEAYFKMTGTGLTFPIAISADTIFRDFTAKTYTDYDCIISVVCPKP